MAGKIHGKSRPGQKQKILFYKEGFYKEGFNKEGFKKKISKSANELLTSKTS
ncbi:MAG: hypothetical protein HFH80_11730 [Lachnospiraceae bacterium]|nr:hypothetical protein [Lachnospiraceae bacterium]